MLPCFFLLQCIRGGEDDRKWGKMGCVCVCAKVARHANVNEDEEVMEAVAANKQPVQGVEPSSAGFAVEKMVPTCFMSQVMLSKPDL